jgi:hypothetical protein
MPAVLTTQPAQDTYGAECPEHPEYDRTGLTQGHAMNVVAKHNRDSHGLVEVDLRAMAALVWFESARHPVLMRAWETLTGTHGQEALDLGARFLDSGSPVIATVAPF